ncbi:type VI secretion system baseplate subunit TssE, partial [Vibrio parahaemolyticus]|nr:type VI secretion system baseplate subunit TssE [Vibrio parahaemolyticus]
VCIEQFEPRLSAVSIMSHTDEGNPLTLRFMIEAQLNSDALHESVRFQLMLDSNHQYRVM